MGHFNILLQRNKGWTSTKFDWIWSKIVSFLAIHNQRSEERLNAHISGSNERKIILNFDKVMFYLLKRIVLKALPNPWAGQSDYMKWITDKISKRMKTHRSCFICALPQESKFLSLCLTFFLLRPNKVI